MRARDRQSYFRLLLVLIGACKCRCCPGRVTSDHVVRHSDDDMAPVGYLRVKRAHLEDKEGYAEALHAALEVGAVRGAARSARVWGAVSARGVVCGMCAVCSVQCGMGLCGVQCAGGPGKPCSSHAPHFVLLDPKLF